MKQQILENLNNPEILEKLYRDNKQDFSKAFDEISNDYNSDLLRFWKIRLASKVDTEFKGFMKLDLFIIIIA